jgi:hypothetical protein
MDTASSFVSIFGRVAVEPTPAQSLVEDMVLADTEDCDEGYAILGQVIALGSAAATHRDAHCVVMDPEDYETIFTLKDDTFGRVVATLYGGDDQPRQVIDAAQVRYGGWFVCALRHFADGQPWADEEPEHVNGIFGNLEDDQLITFVDDWPTLTDAGQDLLADLNSIYPDYAGDWRVNPEETFAL